MSYRIGTVRYQNFGPFEDVEVDFAQSGLTVIEGRIDGKRGCDSNGCLAGDTLIDMPRDLGRYPKGVPLKSLVGKQPHVYSWDRDARKIVVRQAMRVWKTKRARTVTVRVTPYATARGSGHGGTYRPPLQLRGTPDHLVLLSDGVTWKPLGSLIPGDGICSMYRRWAGRGSRFLIYWTGLSCERAVSEQQFVCAAVSGERPNGCHAHHLDGNVKNNSCDNLAWIDASVHLGLHTAECNRNGVTGWQKTGVHPRGMAGKSHTEETRRRISASCKGKGRPRTGRDVQCATCGAVFYVYPSSTRRYCSLECHYNRVNHTVLTVEESSAINVYDMEVPGTHNFIANGMVVHNSGKTMLFEAIAWALYGRCMRERMDADAVVRHESGGNTVVEVNLHTNGRKVLVTRYRKHAEFKNDVRLWADGQEVTRGTVAQTNEAIIHEVGMDFATYCNSVAFGARQDVRSFFAASDSERKALLERLLGLELFTEAQKVTRRRLKDVADQLDQLTTAIGELDGYLLARRENLESVLADVERLQDMEQQRSKERMRAKQIERWMKTNEDECQAMEQTRDGILGAHQVKEAAYQATCDGFEPEREQKRKEIRAFNDKRAERRADLRHDQAEIDALTQLGKKKNCPTCKQPVSATKTKELVLALGKRATRARHDVADFDQVIEVQEQELAAIVDPEPPKAPDLNELQDKIKEKSNQWSAWNSEKRGLRQSVKMLTDQLDRHDKQVTTLKQQVEETQQQLQGITEKSDVLKQQAAELEFWVEGFGNQGLKSFLIEAEIPEINRRATTFARRLLGDGVSVQLSATRVLKTRKGAKEELSIQTVIPECTTTYAGASAGQKRRLDLCLLLAFRDLIAARQVKPFDQFFADEIFDGLDQSGVESVAEMLQELSRDCPVALVTHDARIKDVGDRVWVVHHRNGVASVMLDDLTGGANTSPPPPAKRKKPLKPSLRKRMEPARRH